MKKLTLVAFATVSAAILTLASAPQDVSAGKPCASTKHKTELISKACEKGGQGAAKKAMKKFLSKAKQKDSSLNCKSCHTSLSPKYELKPDALKKFKKLGGK